MIALRFRSDKSVPDARFATLKREFGASFEAIELEDKDALKGDRPPHSVLTFHMKEEGPTKAAEQRVIAFFKQRDRGVAQRSCRLGLSLRLVRRVIQNEVL